MMIIGLGFIGMGASASVIPIIPEMIDAVGNDFRSDIELKDCISGIFNMANGFGQIAGPLMAGALDDWVGFRATCDTMSVMLLIFLITYFFACDGVSTFKTSMANMKKNWGSVGSAHEVLIDETMLTDEESEKNTDDEADQFKGAIN